MRGGSAPSRLLEMSLDELDAARDWMLLLGRKTAREKVATFLALVFHRAPTSAALASTSTTTFVSMPSSRSV